MKENSFFCSWSGGKDSALALYRIIKQGLTPKVLLTMFREDGLKSRSHGFSKHILYAQGAALNIPLDICSASWQDYREVFVAKIKEYKALGVHYGVFGDIDIEDHRIWVEGVCKETGINPILPLWGEERVKLVKELISVGFKSIIVTIKNDIMDNCYLGRTIDLELIEELQCKGIDPCGERGEFHTLVIDGPIFKNPLNVTTSNIVSDSGYSFLEVNI